jgi:hypothetical protein
MVDLDTSDGWIQLINLCAEHDGPVVINRPPERTWPRTVRTWIWPCRNSNASWSCFG